MEFEVRMTISVESRLALFRAGRAHYKNNPDIINAGFQLSGGKKFLLYAVLLVVFVASVFVRELHWMLRGFPIFVAGIMFAMILFSYVASSEKVLRKQFEKDEFIGRLHVFHFSDDSFQSSIADRETRYSYRAIQAVYETDEYFILFVTKTTAEAVRKSAFTLGDPADFADFIQQKTGLPVRRL